MQTALYVIWFLLPLFFVIFAIWAKLEQWQGQPKRERAGDYARQAVFTFVCAVIAVLLDQYVVTGLVNWIDSSLMPLGLAQILLYPLVLLVGARFIGGTPQEHIAPPSLRPKPKQKF